MDMSIVTEYVSTLSRGAKRGPHLFEPTELNGQRMICNKKIAQDCGHRKTLQVKQWLL